MPSALRQFVRIDQCYLWAALGLALESCAGQFDRIAATALSSDSSLERSVLSTGLCLLVALAVFACSKRRNGALVFPRRFWAIGIGALFSIGLCCNYANHLLSFQSALLPGIGNSVATVAGYAFLFVWYERIINLGLKGALTVVGLGLVFRSALQALFLMLNDASSMCLMIALPLLSLPCFSNLLRKTAQEDPPTQALNAPLPFRRKRATLAILLAIIGLISLVSSDLSFNDIVVRQSLTDHLLTIVVNALIGIAILLFARLTFSRSLLFLFVLTNAATAFCAFFLFANDASNSGMAWAFFAQVSTRLLDCLIIFPAFVFSESEKPQFHLFALARLVARAGFLSITIIAGSGLPLSPNLGNSVQSAALIGLLVGIVVFYATIQPSTHAQSPDAEDAPDPISPIRKPFEEALESVSEQGRLTPSEHRVLRLVARGMNANSAAQELGVSANTTKTHIRNIYNKLGVHSQQELISLVNDVIDISKMPDENHGTGKPHPR